MDITLANCLRSEYEKRNRRNKAYSLRSFARDLSLSSGRLSDIINKEAAVSEKTLTFLAEKLALDEFVHQELSAQELDKRKGLAKFEIIEFEEEIQITATHMAILVNIPDSYITVNDLLKDCKDRELIMSCLYDLCDIGHLEMEQGESNIFIRNSSTSIGRVIFKDENSRKAYFEDCFKISLNAIRDIETSKRIHSTSVLMINESELPQLQEHFREFRGKLLQSLNSKESSSSDKAYVMALSLSPIFND